MNKLRNILSDTYIDVINKINNKFINISDTDIINNNFDHNINVFHKPFIYDQAVYTKDNIGLFKKESSEDLFDLRSKTSTLKTINPYEDLVDQDVYSLRSLFDIGYWDGLPITYKSNINYVAEKKLLFLQELHFDGNSYYSITPPNATFNSVGDFIFDMKLPSGQTGKITIIDLCNSGSSYPRLTLDYDYDNNFLTLTSKNTLGNSNAATYSITSFDVFKSYKLSIGVSSFTVYVDNVLVITLSGSAFFDWTLGPFYTFGANNDGSFPVKNGTIIKNTNGLIKFGQAYKDYDYKTLADSNQKIHVIELIGTMASSILYQNDVNKRASGILNIDINSYYNDAISKYGLSGSKYNLIPPFDSVFGYKDYHLPPLWLYNILSTNFPLTYNQVNTDYKLGINKDSGQGFGYLKNCNTLNKLKASLLFQDKISYIDFASDSTLYAEFQIAIDNSSTHDLAVFIPFKLNSSSPNATKFLLRSSDNVLQLSVEKLSTNSIRFKSTILFSDATETTYNSRNVLINTNSFHIFCYIVNHNTKEMKFFLDGQFIDSVFYNIAKTAEDIADSYIYYGGNNTGSNSGLILGDLNIYDLNNITDTFLSTKRPEQLSFYFGSKYSIIA